MFTYLGIIIGIILANFTKSSLQILAMTTIFGVAIFITIQKIKLKYTRLHLYNVLLTISLFLLSFTYSNLFISHVNQQLIQERIEHLQVNGVIYSLIQRNENLSTFYFKISNGYLKNKIIQIYDYNQQYKAKINLARNINIPAINVICSPDILTK